MHISLSRNFEIKPRYSRIVVDENEFNDKHGFHSADSPTTHPTLLLFHSEPSRDKPSLHVLCLNTDYMTMWDSPPATSSSPTFPGHKQGRCWEQRTGVHCALYLCNPIRHSCILNVPRPPLCHSLSLKWLNK